MNVYIIIIWRGYFQKFTYCPYMAVVLYPWNLAISSIFLFLPISVQEDISIFTEQIQKIPCFTFNKHQTENIASLTMDNFHFFSRIVCPQHFYGLKRKYNHDDIFSEISLERVECTETLPLPCGDRETVFEVKEVENSVVIIETKQYKVYKKRTCFMSKIPTKIFLENSWGKRENWRAK